MTAIATAIENAPPSRRILIVDDEEGIRTFLTRLLARLPKPPPIEIETAPSAEDALSLMQIRKYALVLTDFNMGGKDGIFLLSTAREKWPETVRLLMTGYTDEQIYRDAVERGGVAAFIRKPWNNQEFLQLIATLLREGKASASAPQP